jgi:hypothetical protein
MARGKKARKRSGPKKNTPGRKRRRSADSQTQQPFEQDSKRRIGQFGGTGEPPIMQ